VRLVADDDRVGVRDPAGVADEPLVGLDGDRAVRAIDALVVQQRAADPVAIPAVAQLAVELVDEVPPVGEDQGAAGARGLDEAERGDGLPSAGRVLEPEAAVGAGVLGRRLLPVLRGLGRLGLRVPVERLLVLVDLVVALQLDLARAPAPTP